MKLLINKANVDTTDPDYPLGKARDKTPSVAGSRHNVEMWGDILQFFAKMFDDSSLSANGNPDNATNGYQLFEAFRELTNPTYITTGITYATSGAYSWSNVGGSYYDVGFSAAPNKVHLCGAASSAVTATADTPIMTLPAAARPAKTVRVLASKQDGSSTPERIVLEITSAGVVTAKGLASTLGTYTINFDGISYRK